MGVEKYLSFTDIINKCFSKVGFSRGDGEDGRFYVERQYSSGAIVSKIWYSQRSQTVYIDGWWSPNRKSRGFDHPELYSIVQLFSDGEGEKHEKIECNILSMSKVSEKLRKLGK